MAGEDLLRHLDGDVTLLPPLVEIQQVGSEARGRLGNSACGEDEIMRADRMRVSQAGRVRVCDKNKKLCVLLPFSLYLWGPKSQKPTENAFNDNFKGSKAEPHNLKILHFRAKTWIKPC